MADFKETSFDYLDVDDHAVFCTAERKWINKILKLKESHPNEVKIKNYPESNGGYIVAEVPKTWFKFGPPAKRELTEEQRTAMAERLSAARKKREC